MSDTYASNVWYLTEHLNRFRAVCDDLIFLEAGQRRKLFLVRNKQKSYHTFVTSWGYPEFIHCYHMFLSATLPVLADTHLNVQ